MHFHVVKMYKDKEVKNVKNFFVNVWRKSIFDIYVTEYGTALTSRKSLDNLKFEQKYKFKGHNSAKYHSTGTKFELKL
jgi:hypothetical protein